MARLPRVEAEDFYDDLDRTKVFRDSRALEAIAFVSYPRLCFDAEPRIM
jgi:hypothetical protein